jgi:hypothetical protein
MSVYLVDFAGYFAEDVGNYAENIIRINLINLSQLN